jgi:hypothetical protein
MSEADDNARSQGPAPSDGQEQARPETFLRRWSRRKQEARREEHSAPVPAAPPSPGPEAAPPKILTDADMPPIESLDGHSDFSLFMSPGVSDELRARALRKLFSLPEFNVRCPLDGEWFDGAGAEPLGDVITHEMREEMERAARMLEEAGQRTPPDDDARARAGSAPPGTEYGDLPAPAAPPTGLDEGATAGESPPVEVPRKEST